MIKGRVSVVLLVLLLLLFAAGGVVLVLLNEREPPTVHLAADYRFLGASQPMTVTVDDVRSGVRSLAVRLRQAGKEQVLLAEEYPRQGYFNHSGANHLERTVTVEPAALGYRDGRAELVVEARDFSFWNFLAGNTTTVSRTVIIDTTKPRLRILASPRYIRAGGTSLIRYRVNEEVEGHGAVINGHFYPGVVAKDSDPLTMVAVLALPYDTEEIREMYVTAADRAGNTARANFSMVLRSFRPRHDRIQVSDRFLDRKLPELAEAVDLPGDEPVAQYLYLNRQERAKDNDTIRRICSTVTVQRHWQGRFLRLPRSSRRSSFADHRTYYYKGKQIDSAVHLGIDLASVRNAPVSAAAAGTVVFADFLGIYGNLVIVDHGWGVFSLYSHLSEVGVAKGDAVESGGYLGRTGSTGMAGGDHLHFGVVVNGVFVDPVEWWDQHWLEQNLLSYL